MMLPKQVQTYVLSGTNIIARIVLFPLYRGLDLLKFIWRMSGCMPFYFGKAKNDIKRDMAKETELQNRIDDLENELRLSRGTADSALGHIKKLEHDMETLRIDLQTVLRERNTLHETSNEITRHMAATLEAKGVLENQGDPYAESKLSTTFDKLYDNEWTVLLETLTDALEIKEVKGITEISKLLEECYNMCVRYADNQLRHFLFLSENDPIPIESETKDAGLLKSRRLHGQKEVSREHICQNITTQLFKQFDDVVKGLNEETRGKFSDFFKHYTDCCWLMTISNPRMMLCFDVVGKPHVGKTAEMFRKYPLDDKICDAEKAVGTILLVVWPAITAERYICKKGAVITIDKQVPVNKNLNKEVT